MSRNQIQHADQNELIIRFDQHFFIERRLKKIQPPFRLFLAISISALT